MAIGWPISTGPLEGLTRSQVDQMVVSVGPYIFHAEAERVSKASGRISAERLLPAAGGGVWRVGPELPPPGRGAEGVVAAGSSPGPPPGGVVAG